MKQFMLLPSAAKGQRKALLIRMLFVCGFIITVLFIVPMIMTGNTSFNLASLLTLLLIFAVLPIGYYSGLRRLKATLSSYKLTISDHTITREINQVPTIVIPIHEVQQITRNMDGSYIIKGHSALNAIGVPAGIDRSVELEELLAAIKPLAVKTDVSIWQKFQYLIILVLGGVMYGSFIVENKYAATGMGIVFIAVMGYSLLVQQRSKNVSRRMKLLSYITIIPAISVLMRIISLWTN